MDRKPGILYTLCHEMGEERAKFFNNKKSANNLYKIIRKTLYTLRFADFLIHTMYSQRKTYEIPTRYRSDTGENS